jgi:hypothetical protein
MAFLRFVFDLADTAAAGDIVVASHQTNGLLLFIVLETPR